MSVAQTDALIQHASRPDAHFGAQTQADGLWEGRTFTAMCVLWDAAALVICALIFASGPLAVHAESVAWPLALPPLALVIIGVRGGSLEVIGSSVAGGLARAAGGVAIAVTAVVLVATAVGAGAHVGPVVLCGAAAVAAIAAGRLVLARRQHWVRRHRRTGRPTLIVGAGQVGTRIALRLLGDPTYGLRPVGFIDGPDIVDDPGPEDLPLPVLGAFDELAEIASGADARHAIIAFSGSVRDAELRPFVSRCERIGMGVSVVPRFFDLMGSVSSYERLGGLPLVGLHSTTQQRGRLAVKRATDAVLAGIALVALAPLLAVIALAVRLESPGPTLFRQVRVGRDGRTFEILKFRTMRVDGDVPKFVPGPDTAPGGVEGADRRTVIGRWLRRTSLDELPQLINILRGEMSVVGPRPERPEYSDIFTQNLSRYGERLRLRPGLTGWAQVCGFRGQTSLADRVEWDNYYIEHWSFGLDARIVLRTVAALFQPGED